jgi:hypothetical protein
MASNSHATTDGDESAENMRQHGIDMTMLDAGGGQAPTLNGIMRKLNEGMGEAKCVLQKGGVVILSVKNASVYKQTAQELDMDVRELEATMRELALFRMWHDEYVSHFIRDTGTPLVFDVRWLWHVEPL